jgi:hypothetical protein
MTTGTGDGLNFDFLNEPDPVPAPKPEPVPEPVVPSPLALPEGLELGELEEPSSSIFDEGPEGPIGSLDQVPEAVPNISDGGTEILAKGRTELREFEEQFSAASEPEVPFPQITPEPSPVEELAASPEPAAPVPEAEPAGSLLDGLFDSVAESPSDATPLTVSGVSEPSAETAVLLSPLSPAPPSAPIELPAAESTGLSGLNLDLGSADASPATAADAPRPASDLSDSLTLGAAATAAAAATGFNDLGTTSSPSASATRAKPVPADSQRVILIALAGYAALITLLCLFLLMMLAKARQAGQLESLPELQPLSRDRVALYPVNLELPASHVLKIGEARRFGNLRVEPIKVTRGPAELVHYSGDRERGSYKTSPVLRLWFKFTNESQEQSFVPIDHDLVFLRNDSGVRANNNFLVERSRKPAGGPLVLTFDHTDSSHDFAGQNLGRPLGPGESIEAFYPTSEDEFESLRGDLVWRVQLRKGLGPSGHGVTTLIEVAFTSDEIQADGT